ncbi:Kunitz/Bovine pancreatic trypsin inhibitor domain protein [Oesophagostomum dentatum]|uniref:Kunitz/Bovine pancreatic trypsin inhibitor domain protein n=1 Tax=Oesophagostomum dentatum TaxID=61180 RepID=A0A0B1T7A4_OESDE|nr:Kunitz/Bovine pancreatic trypsin inhibitor domain protein [Oesophagostomum dentatum]
MKLKECLPFLYKGCGGNLNSYPTSSSCVLACSANSTEVHLAHTKSCSGGEEITGRCRSLGDCPAGSICIMGDSNKGMCCNSTLEEEYKKDKDPKCEELVVKTPTLKGWKPLLGRNCTHNFCPKFSKCIQGHYLAHCCGQN